MTGRLAAALVDLLVAGAMVAAFVLLGVFATRPAPRPASVIPAVAFPDQPDRRPPGASDTPGNVVPGAPRTEVSPATPGDAFEVRRWNPPLPPASQPLGKEPPPAGSGVRTVAFGAGTGKPASASSSPMFGSCNSPCSVVIGCDTGTCDTAVAIRATWYCVAGVSRCTRGYPPSCLCAAISPDLRAWAGWLLLVTVPSGASVVVRAVDCDCQTEHGIDLYGRAFARLAPLSVGVIYATVEVVE